MVLIGCDFHPSWQQVSWMNRETGEAGDQKLVHEPGAVEKFYQQFPAGTRIGMEATGNCQWFVEMVTGLGHKVLVGAAAPGDEPRRDEEAKAVEQSRRESASRVTACAMGQPAARRPVQGKRDVERAD